MATTNGTKLTFLHLTDCHLDDTSTVDSVDRKVMVGGMSPPLRSEVLRNTLRELAKSLLAQNTNLKGVLFSGDGTLKGDPSGQKQLRGMLLDELSSVGITASNIVATPGNHDVAARSNPSEPARYDLFKGAWIEPECVVVPFLDGIHDIKNLNYSEHVLRGSDGTWAIFPINTANWSQVSIPDDENPQIASLRKLVKASGNATQIEALEKLCTYDVARVSPEQLQALKEMVKAAGEVSLRIAVLHHHLLPVDSREEFKAFADITNLGALRQVLRELGFHIVVHGHKHTSAAYYDHIYADDATSQSAHRMLTVSGGTFGPTGLHPDNPLHLIEIEGLPFASVCKIKAVSSASPGRGITIGASQSYRLWENDPHGNGPITIYGASIDDVYVRALQAIAQHQERTIICTVNLPNDNTLPFPQSYPYEGSEDERREWFNDTVRWWQLPASRIEKRIPYIHGSRLKRFGGGIDQIERVVELLTAQRSGQSEQATSKAIALVIDPARDFRGDKPFACFCFVQFCLRPENRLDCIGYYRAQEFNHWWPVNVAELRHLQKEVAEKAHLALGEITTITPYPRLSAAIRHPSKVAVPLIDQWMDNHPVRIAKIAMALAKIDEAVSREGLIYWKRCYEDIKQAAETEFHEDGVQVSIEGLELLREWLGAATSDKQIIGLIDDLLHANNSYKDSEGKQADFARWRGQVLDKLARLDALATK